MSTLQQNIDAINHDISMAFNNLFDDPNQALQMLVDSIKTNKEKTIMEPNDEQSDYTITVNDKEIDLYEIISREISDHDLLSPAENTYVLRVSDIDDIVKNVTTAVQEQIPDMPNVPKLPDMSDVKINDTRYFTTPTGSLIKYYKTGITDSCPWGIYAGNGNFNYVSDEYIKKRSELFPLDQFTGSDTDE